ncbi:surface glycoprotein [Halobaculum halobium]
MTETNNKIRALFLTALMVFSVFAGTVAFAGTAAAANNATVTANPADADATSTHTFTVEPAVVKWVVR